MLNEEEILVLDKKGQDITSNIVEWFNGKIKVRFGTKTYFYNRSSLIMIKNPISLEHCCITTSNKKLTNIKMVRKFGNYIKVFFHNGKKKTYHQSEVLIEYSLLTNPTIQTVFNYLKEMANHITIMDIIPSETEEQDQSQFLSKLYEKLNFINEKSVIKDYILGITPTKDHHENRHRIYPFRFNLSQQHAINNAFTNKISIIEGPPGTGKTQTILNIIANAIIDHKTVAVLSNNNSATDNVFEKLEKEDLGSLCAKLGKKKNIKHFLENQINTKKYPIAWYQDETMINDLKEQLSRMNNDIEWYLEEKNNIAMLRQEKSALELEQKYFLKSIDLSSVKSVPIPNFHADTLHDYFIYLNKQENKTDFFSKRVAVLSQLKFHFWNPDLYKKNIRAILDTLEYLYYKKKIKELTTTIKEKEAKIKELKLKSLFEDYTEKSLKIFKSYVFQNYNNKREYTNKNIKNTEELTKDYPVILSTTYSLLNCVTTNFMFDYMIVDESSQVDLVSSFPALTMAKKIIIVGDSKQLPNIIDNKKEKYFNDIFEKYKIETKYNYIKNSLLELTKQVKNVTSPILLKEHYRCHPKIIDFCNKKFYNNELIILSENEEKDPMKQYKCQKGNHARRNNHSQFNDRQAQVIKDEVIPQEKINIDKDSIGIITPYKEQKKYLKEMFSCDNLAIDTVHGFQGREKDIIIFSTVANDITKFLDNPNSINVAVSRAINKFYLVTPYEYTSKENSNISNLISYINYNKFKVVQSKINSVFDLLYKPNEHKRKKYLKTHIIFSNYDSETIAYNTIKEILDQEKYNTYEVKNKVYPLKKLVKDEKILNEEEVKFINRNAHVDFLIFNKFDKKPVLVIEVDGYYFHNRKEQIIRDQKKNSILRKCNIPLLRLKTNESREKERITKKLDEIIENYENA